MKKLFILLLVIGFGVLVGCDNSQDHEIKVYTRDTTSGTRDGFFTVIDFKDAVKDNSVLVNGYIEVTGNGDMINSLRNDVYGIGYISLSSYQTSNLKGLLFDGVKPSVENVNNGSYKLTRNFNYVIRTEFDSDIEQQIVNAYVAYMNTKEGKAAILNSDGIVDIKSSDPSWEDIKVDHPVALNDNSDITIRFGGSTSVEKVAKALSAEFSLKCGNFRVEHSHTGSGDGFKRTQGDEKDGANNVHIGFASRDFYLTSSELMADGTYGLVCVDAIVVVVDKNNSLPQITSQILRDIYSGAISKWSELE